MLITAWEIDLTVITSISVSAAHPSQSLPSPLCSNWAGQQKASEAALNEVFSIDAKAET
jgi:hypothetical protein